MKNRITAIFLAAAVLLCSSGCALFETEYTYSEPYVDSLDRNDGDATEVRNYNMLKGAILDMINRHDTSAELRFTNYNGAVSDDIAAACLEIKTVNPLGAYAVETLTYDTSRIVSYYIAEVEITYKRTAEQLRSIRNVNSSAELQTFLRDEVLPASQSTAVVRVYQPQINAQSIEQMLEQIYFEDPVALPLPVKGKVEGYPNEGSSRIYEISLQYTLYPAQRRGMTEKMQESVEKLVQQAAAEEPARRALLLAQLLSGGLTETAGEFGDTAYGALAEHSADSRGIALAYGTLCRASGIPCTVVKGSIGSMGTEEHFWNIAELDGDYYHVDVSRFADDPANAFLISDGDLWGTYIWNTENYPACSGTLRYRDIVPETETPESPAETEVQEPPAEEVQEPPAEKVQEPEDKMMQAGAG